jgi:glycosyltransferase involved in cell wall biosynthesis
MNSRPMSLQSLKLRTVARLSGRAAESRVLSEILGQALLVRASLPGTPPDERLDALLKACRRTRLGSSLRRLRRKLLPYLEGEHLHVGRGERVGWQRDDESALTTSLVLKAPGPNGEKGVLYVSFEYNWLRLVAHHDAGAVLDDYYLVGASSWTPTDYATISAFAGLSEDPIFVGVSNLADMGPIGLMRPVAEPVAILASDWVNPAYYEPRPHDQRSIDVLVVANWTRVKRHWLLFEALREMPRNARVVLVGRNAPGRTEKEIRAEARAFGVRQDLELHTNLTIDEVTALQCDARISAIFTHREGSCVAVPESLFADAPVAMMAEAHIGSKAYINRQTGVLLGRRRLARQLRRFWEESGRYNAREWALRNISCAATTRRLNAILRGWARRTGRPWTEDIAPMCWRYVPSYVNAADEARLAPAVERLRRRHGVVLEKFRGERAPKKGAAAQAAEAPIAILESFDAAPDRETAGASATTAN